MSLLHVGEQYFVANTFIFINQYIDRNTLLFMLKQQSGRVLYPKKCKRFIKLVKFILEV